IDLTVGLHAPRHSLEAEDVLREESEVEAGEHQPEAPAPERLADHPARPFREPVMKPGEDREEHATDQHIVEVCNDEVGVMYLPVEGHRCNHHAGHAAQDEGEEKTADEEQWHPE